MWSTLLQGKVSCVHKCMLLGVSGNLTQCSKIEATLKDDEVANIVTSSCQVQ